MKRILLAISLVFAVGFIVEATVYSRQVNVTGTATRLDANSSGETAVLVNQGAGSVFVGDVGVTTSTGLELKPGSSLGFNLAPSDRLYGITSGSTYRVDVVENGR